MIVDAEVLLRNGTTGDPSDCDGCAERIALRLRELPGVDTVEVQSEPLRLRYTYETDGITPEQVQDLVERELAGLESRYVHEVLAIEGMDCADCALTLERGVGRLDGVEHASVNFGAARMTLEYDNSVVSVSDIQRRVLDLGYAVSAPDAPPQTERTALWSFLTRRATLIMLASGVLTLTGAIGMLAGAPSIFPVIAWASAVAVGGLPLLRKGLVALRTSRSLDINLLMSLAVIGAAAIGDWFEAATVVFLFSLGESLEGYAMDRVRRSVRSLLSLAPSVALVRRGEVEQAMPVAEVVPGDLVIVRAGERVPLDGIVVDGMSSVDQSSLTGESMPVPREPGDPLFAGTMNGSGPLTMRVTRLAGDSSVARIIRMVETAQAQRAPVQRLVDRFARIYTPGVIAGAIAVATVPPLFGASFGEWLYRALVLLVISCPCALVLSTPISIVSALSAAARNGILIKGGVVLERAAAINTIAFDKTGTLTAGKPHVTTIVPVTAHDESHILALAASLERHSEHPLGRAIVDAAAERRLEVRSARNERVIPGAGLTADIDGVGHRIGSARLFETHAVTPEVARSVESIEARGGTAVLVGDDWLICGVIGLADTPRLDARLALDDLRNAGIDDFVMLSGDRAPAVAQVAEAVGITRFQSGLLPDEKLAAIGKLRDEGWVVAMVGDGVNDAPSLAAADIGIAMGVAGTDAAVETADIALMGDDLRGLAATIRLGKRARRIIGANIALSLATKAVFLTLAVTGHATLWMAIAADMGTSLVVIANGMRLLRRPGDHGHRAVAATIPSTVKTRMERGRASGDD